MTAPAQLASFELTEPPHRPAQSPQRVTTVLASFESWLQHQAATMLAPGELSATGLDRDDLTQTGRVAMWQALETHNPVLGPLTAWVTSKARYAMIAAVRATPTPSEHTTRRGDATRASLIAFTIDFRRQQRREPRLKETASALGLSQAAASVQLSRIRAGLGAARQISPPTLVALPTCNDDTLPAADDVEAAAAERITAEKVRGALAALTPRQREYVTLRFFAGYNNAELTTHFGYDPRGLWAANRTGARDKLAATLADLDPRT